jgi:uncharacterized protein
MTASPQRYIPELTGVNARLHEQSVAEGRLCLQSCDKCGTWQHPPRTRCPRCAGAAFTFKPVSGAGTCYSFTTSYRTADRGWSESVPYTTAVVELAEGPRVITAWRDRHRAPRPDEAVTVVTEIVEGRFAFLWAEPAGQERTQP